MDPTCMTHQFLKHQKTIDQALIKPYKTHQNLLLKHPPPWPLENADTTRVLSPRHFREFRISCRCGTQKCLDLLPALQNEGGIAPHLSRFFPQCLLHIHIVRTLLRSTVSDVPKLANNPRLMEQEG